MANSIKITIPTPCHEDWANMTPADRGRFCDACQKTVVDFTSMGDRDIAAYLKANTNVCGNFRESQLDRQLVIPTEKNRTWAIAGAAALAVLSLGTTPATAQEPVTTTQSPVNNQQDPETGNAGGLHTLNGRVVNQDQVAMKNITVLLNKGEKAVVTDANGNFTLDVQLGDTLGFSREGLVDTRQVITEEVLNKPVFTVYTTLNIRGKVMLKP